MGSLSREPFLFLVALIEISYLGGIKERTDRSRWAVEEGDQPRFDIGVRPVYSLQTVPPQPTTPGKGQAVVVWAVEDRVPADQILQRVGKSHQVKQWPVEVRARPIGVNQPRPVEVRARPMGVDQRRPVEVRARRSAVFVLWGESGFWLQFFGSG